MDLTARTLGEVGSSARIVGVGARTSVGLDAPMTAASVRAGITRLRESRRIDLAGEPMVVATASFLPDDVHGDDRLAALALPAIREALAPIAPSSARARSIPPIPLLLGLPSPRPGCVRSAEHELLANLIDRAGAPVTHRQSDLTASGHAAAVAAIARGMELIDSGRSELVLAGGVDSYDESEALEWLDASGRLHSERHLDGFVPGEGAGFCLLASARLTRALGLAALARPRSAAVTVEPCPLTSQGVCTGIGLTAAFHGVLADLRDDERADWTLCDLNGESFRATEWMYAYVRSGKKHRDPLEIWHPADSYGDIGAASGAVMAALAVAAWAGRYARGPRCLVWTSSDEGARGALLLEAA